MRDKVEFSLEERDERVTGLLRALMNAPSDPAYWDALAARIMARMRMDEDAWWQPFGGWVQAGLLAAAVAGVALGLTLLGERQAQSRWAYQTIVETPRTLPAQLATQTGLPAREATLRYVIGP
jgi:hypothetical protein